MTVMFFYRYSIFAYKFAILLLWKEVRKIARKKKQGEVDRNVSDYLDSLNEQMEFIVNACKLYDEGNYFYAKQIATHIRVLVHDTKQSISLFNLMEKKDTMKFCSTASFPKKAVLHISFISPVNKVIDGKSEHTFVPNLNESGSKSNKKWVNFETWYDQKVLVSGENTFTRKDMILYLANKDGGAHIDPYIEERYYKISKGLESFLYSSSGPSERLSPNQDKPFLNLINAAVRQIAHELILSIRKNFNIRPNYNPSFKTYGLNGIHVQDIIVVKGEAIEYER